MALASPSSDGQSAVEAGHETGAPEVLAFMPRLFVLTTLPHRRPQGHRFERVNGWQSLRMEAPRRVGLPYGVYPRLLLMFLTTEAVRKKTREIYLGTTPNDLARKLGVSIVSGPRGTAQRLEAQVRRLTATTWSWRSVEPASHFAVSRRTAPTTAPSLHTLAVSLGLSTASWRSRLLLHEHFFSEITRSAVPVDPQAIHQLIGSPLAFDLYTWLTHRMSYLRKPTLVPWKGLQAQLGADYARPRDFRRTALARLDDVVAAYPELRIQRENEGLRLYPSPPHVKSHSLKRALRLAPSPRERIRYESQNLTFQESNSIEHGCPIEPCVLLSRTERLTPLMSSARRLGEMARATRRPGATRRPKCGTDPGVDQRELCAGGRIPEPPRPA